MNGKFYTGVGARSTPLEICHIITRVAETLAAQGWTLRSGGAKGADSAFEAGANGRSEIFRPADATPAAMAIAARYHGAWHKLSDYVRRLHARNSFQVLGRNLNSPSRFLICWTEDGCLDHAHRTVKTGGTGTAISIASENRVPVFNLARPEHRERLIKFISSCS